MRLKHMLAGLGEAGGPSDAPLVLNFVDSRGNQVEAPYLYDFEGNRRLDPNAIILQDSGEVPIEFTHRGSASNMAWQSLPGVRAGLIQSGDLVVLTAEDLQTPAGIVSVTPIRPAVPGRSPAPPGSPGYVGPARPSSLPMPVDTPTQQFTQPAPPAPPAPPALVAPPAPPAPGFPVITPTTGAGAALLPSWQPTGGGIVVAGDEEPAVTMPYVTPNDKRPGAGLLALGLLAALLMG